MLQKRKPARTSKQTVVANIQALNSPTALRFSVFYNTVTPGVKLSYNIIVSLSFFFTAKRFESTKLTQSRF